MVRIGVASLLSLALTAASATAVPDSAGAKNIGNEQGKQFVSGQCLSNADCASNCCAQQNIGEGICSAVQDQFKAGKTGCGFVDCGAGAAGFANGGNGRGSGGNGGINCTLPGAPGGNGGQGGNGGGADGGNGGQGGNGGGEGGGKGGQGGAPGADGGNGGQGGNVGDNGGVNGGKGCDGDIGGNAKKAKKAKSGQR